MARSLPGQIMFHDDNDRKAFLRLLGDSLARVEYQCYAWSLLSNHFHIVIRSSERELWELMKPLNTGYARYHKTKYRREGPLFRDRYKSIITQDQRYIGELVRYVHLNPVRAGICRDLAALDHYLWTGHHVLMGNGGCTFLEVAAVLRKFGDQVPEARQRYRAFLQEAIEKKENDNELVRLVRESNEGIEAGRRAACWVIGDREFVKRALSASAASCLRIRRFEKEGCDVQAIAAAVAGTFQVPVECIARRSRGGKGSEARKVFAYIAVREYGVPSSVVAQFCGVGTTAISMMVRAGREKTPEAIVREICGKITDRDRGG